MPKNADKKREKILEIAKRRFAHYGLAKTTMAEIAKDLAFSKALLYYYFPDKNSLYVAVIEDISEEMDLDLRRSIDSVKTVEEGLYGFLEKRLDFLKRYFYIIEYTFQISKEVNDDIGKVLFDSFCLQKEFVKMLFEKGVKKGELRTIDEDEYASIFLHACTGMRHMVIKDIKSLFVPDREEFEAVLEYQKKLASIFIGGLKK